ncbi:MAG: CRISPR-associated RAMP protein Csx7 [Limnospira sp. PMC 1291.21]|uniref:CRISPR-associated RAMP protein Csx7 n=1 Tax=Limnospira fusiformis PMC 851.14 TaxID=2219512 RepID=A0ABU9EI97_LIMFS|nr:MULTISPECIES: CRISPR-associated RAMP protein Csx7 [unclassified Limnospira]MDT9176083.1 CRISPR-associated RAMP protein Csx7 [Limnospira sp. PMC 1238.20]MDT9186358.1 CRISPR-associated RAMP protein Csx7 [Limnospira sp. PMC 894.15]MDT9191402.1 CRISPR-associated RAMP protein Csx7 [Limnospira sp. PMC 1245.20]MDT9204974.1 CRISPR-associated RAMP protein Csx7 [Limnospira sp. PMC 1243.20]MDT9206781.1 CRISPR-associated RAMP protein Csx7 [Limnospira sp. PMC 1252.20]
MFARFKNRLEITGILHTVTALRVSAGRSLEPIGSDLPVIKDALGRPLIPGSSFKGALRSRLESFLRGVFSEIDADQLRHLVANPANENEWSITSKEMQGFKNSYSDRQLTQVIIEHTDLVSLVFGSPWLSSKFQVRDLTIFDPENNWFGQYQERDGVAIDRDTETAAEGKLYDFQVVPAGTPFEFKAVVENAEEWELGLLMVGLHQFETEQIPLGGGRSRGLGVVRLDIDKMQWVNPDNPEELLEYLEMLVNQDLSLYELNEDEQQGYKQSWTRALIDKLRNVRSQHLTETNAV